MATDGSNGPPKKNEPRLMDPTAMNGGGTMICLRAFIPVFSPEGAPNKHIEERIRMYKSEIAK
jgi:hypothetical protein